jgi:hypothetical protein
MLPSVEIFLQARDELCDRIVQARTQRFRKPIKGAAFHDDQTMIDADIGLSEAPPIIFHLIYSDANGALTGRGFKLLRLGQTGNDIAVGGICFMRSAYRQFKATRIVEVTDLNTGEVSEDGMLFFSDHPLLGLGDGRHRTEEEKAIKEVRDELVILTFVSAADGEIHPLEMEEIVKFVFNSWDEPLDEAVVAARISSFVPDSSAFLRSMDRLCEKPGRVRTLERALRAVVDADKRLHQNEQVFVHYILGRLIEAGKC